MLNLIILDLHSVLCHQNIQYVHYEASKVRQTIKYVTAEPALSVFRRYGKAQRPQVWKSSALFHLQLFKKIS